MEEELYNANTQVLIYNWSKPSAMTSLHFRPASQVLNKMLDIVSMVYSAQN